MREFFHGWRKKVGVLTLVMALLFMGAWVRSFYVTDLIMFPTANAMNSWISDKHGLVWLAVNQTDEEYEEQMKNLELPFIVSFAFPQPLDLRAWKRKSGFCGFEFFDQKCRNQQIRLASSPIGPLSFH